MSGNRCDVCSLRVESDGCLSCDYHMADDSRTHLGFRDQALVDVGISTDRVDYDGNTPSEAACACHEAPANCPKAEMQKLMGKSSVS